MYNQVTSGYKGHETSPRAWTVCRTGFPVGTCRWGERPRGSWYAQGGRTDPRRLTGAGLHLSAGYLAAHVSVPWNHRGGDRLEGRSTIWRAGTASQRELAGREAAHRRNRHHAGGLRAAHPYPGTGSPAHLETGPEALGED